MEPLARGGLTAQQVTDLLLADVLTVSAGCEVLGLDLTFQQDISSDLLDGSVTYVADADAQHRACQIRLSRELPWGQVLLRLYMILSDGVVSARFNVGVFAPVTPKSVIGEPVPTFDVTGYDRLYQLARSVGNSYYAAAGSAVLADVLAAVTASGLTGVLLDGTAQTKTLPADMVWTLIRPERDASGRFLPGHDTDYTWLDVCNDLLATVGYRPLWADADGYFRSEPDVDPVAAPVEFTFDINTPDHIVGPKRELTQDLWQVPNEWVFVQQNRADGAPPATIGASVTGADGLVRTPAGDGIYTVQNPSVGPSSIAGRGLAWPKPVQQFDAADQASLVAQGDAVVAADMRVTATLSVTTGPFPVAGHRDVYAYLDTALGSVTHLKVQSLQWTLDLLGADMTHEWSVIG